MTEIYFVRHAEPNYSNHDDMTRELSEKGLRDRTLVTRFFAGKRVDAVLSSPYKRAVDTVAELALSKNLEIRLVEDFRERKVDSVWIEDFTAFCQRQWADFDYRLTDGETLRQVQQRNIAALSSVLDAYREKTVVIGSHGTALSTILNYYDRSFDYEQFERIKGVMPWIVKITFDGQKCVSIEQFDLFET